MPDTRRLSTDGGLVASQDPRSASAGARVLEAGGNAMDAAVAAALALGVVEPNMSGIGGAAWLTVWPGDGRPVVVVDGTGRSPAAAREDMFELDPAADPSGLYGWPKVVDDANIRGGLAAYVPGAVSALCLAHETFGRISREQVFAPAIELATDGIEVNGFLSAQITQDAYNLRRDPGASANFLPNGLPLRPAGLGPADVLRQPALAATLQRIAELGPAGFYEGPVAASIAATVKAAGGILTAEDLAAYRDGATIIDPVEIEFGGVRVSVPPATGGQSVLQVMRLFEAITRRWPDTGDALRWAMASRLAFADRFAVMTADPEADVPWEHLLSEAHAEEVLDASPEIAAALDAPAKSGCTSHLNVVDADGMAVALTATVLDAFGARIVDPGSGVLLNNGMMWFDPRPGRANSVRPSTPGMTAASPTILSRDGKLVAALGATGGRGIVSAVPQITEGILAGLDPQTAIERPRIHCEGAVVTVDERVPAEQIAELEAAGQEVNLVEETSLTWFFARPNAITVGPDGRRTAGHETTKPAAAAAAA
jgi:gamma-glutamyltranspeptidase/glutathione hydrolase